MIKTFTDELATFESEKDVRFMLCNLLYEQFMLLMKNYAEFEKLNRGVEARDNAVLDTIFRKIRSVVESTPEPDDYEEQIDQMRALLK